MIQQDAGARCSHLLRGLEEGGTEARLALASTCGSAALAAERRLAYRGAVDRFQEP